MSASELDDAKTVVYASMRPTPQYAWPLLASAIGAEVWVKHEDCTPTGAFKVRGGLVYVDRLRRERPAVQGLISATRGNHGQSLAFAGRAHGVPVTIVVPEGNSREKNAATIGWGAELIVNGADFQESREHAIALGAKRGLEAVPPFHRDLVQGVATASAELFESAGELDAVFVPIGMGSGVNALIAVRDLLGYRTEVVGVVSELAPAYQLSVDAGRVVATDSAHTFVDGVACRIPDVEALAGIIAGRARIVALSEDAVADAMRLMYRCTHHLPCPSGAISLAALWAERERWQGRRVAVMMTSSNMDTEVAAAVLAGRTPAP